MCPEGRHTWACFRRSPRTRSCGGLHPHRAGCFGCRCGDFSVDAAAGQVGSPAGHWCGGVADETAGACAAPGGQAPPGAWALRRGSAARRPAGQAPHLHKIVQRGDASHATGPPVPFPIGEFEAAVGACGVSRCRAESARPAHTAADRLAGPAPWPGPAVPV